MSLEPLGVELRHKCAIRLEALDAAILPVRHAHLATVLQCCNAVHVVKGGRRWEAIVCRQSGNNTSLENYCQHSGSVIIRHNCPS